MEDKKYLVKLTGYGLRTFRSNKIDLSKSFVITGKEITPYFICKYSELSRLGIEVTNSSRVVNTESGRSLLTNKATSDIPPEIILIHEDI